MRPVNLIPPEERRDGRRPLRSGPIVYLTIGALALALAGVTALVLTNNQIADRKSEIVQLRRQSAAAKARAQRLAAYSQFRTLSEQRLATVTSLADSRFDWERVLRELSRVLPSDVWLTNLSATASSEVGAGGESSGGGGSGGASLRGSVAGPALEMSGCAKGQEGVAGFITALKDIDGVTRVGVESSALAEEGASGESGGSSEAGGSADCRTRGFIAQFNIVAAFDAAPVPSLGSGAEAAASPAEAPAAGAEESSTTTAAEG